MSAVMSFLEHVLECLHCFLCFPIGLWVVWAAPVVLELVVDCENYHPQLTPGH